MSNLDDFFAEISSLVNQELERLVPSEGGHPQKLRDAMRWSLFAGGKRLRPALVFAVGRTFEAPDQSLFRTAAAVEIIHTYSLIHDDLPSMDDDDLRRGRPTCHKKFGEATAILAGDALQALSFQAIAEDDSLPTHTRLDLMSRLANAAARMVAGQQLDLDAEGADIGIAAIEEIHRNKTGALIRFSAEAGAIIAGASPEDLATVSEYGKRLGLLFQIKDDLLDVTQTTEQLGKTAGKDVQASKATYPALRGVQETQRLANGVYEEVTEIISGLGPRSQLLNELAEFILTRQS